ITYTKTLSLKWSSLKDQSPVVGSSLVERTPSDLRPISTRISSWSIRTITPSTTSPRLILIGVVVLAFKVIFFEHRLYPSAFKICRWHCRKVAVLLYLHGKYAPFDTRFFLSF